jgi:hypothetical protein
LTVVRELARYTLDTVRVQEVRWDKRGTVRAGDYTFFYGKENEDQLATGYFVQQRIVPVIKKVNLLVIGCHIYIQGVSRLVAITAGSDFLGLCDQKSSYKNLSDFGRLQSYGHFLITVHALV